MHHVELVHREPAEDEVDPRVHAHLGQERDPPLPGRGVELRQRPRVARARVRHPRVHGRPRQERLERGRQHADDHVRTGLADQPPHGPGLPGVERDHPRLAVALARDVGLGLADVELGHRDRGDDVALLQVVHHGLALQAHAENQRFQRYLLQFG